MNYPVVAALALQLSLPFYPLFPYMFESSMDAKLSEGKLKRIADISYGIAKKTGTIPGILTERIKTS